jgi:hypothetical protein
MKGNKGTKEGQQAIPVWTYAQAQRALPYIASIMQSAREYHIVAKRCDLEDKRLAAAPGMPDRSALIANAEAIREGRLARERFEEALKELEALGVACPDPIRGAALVPFANQQQLAWLVYNLFDDQPIRFWRYHSDPVDMRRPIEEVQQTTAV